MSILKLLTKNKEAIISTFIIVIFGITFNHYNSFNHNFKEVAFWLFIYSSPIWAVDKLSKFSERNKE